MNTEAIYSKADVLRIASVPEDAFVFWERQGLILGHQKEPRAHKRYSAREAKIAAILNQARLIGMNVGAMRSALEVIRHALGFYDDTAARGPDWLSKVNDGPLAEAQLLWLGETISYWGGLLVLTREQDGQWAAQFGVDERGLPTASAVVLDLDQITLRWPPAQEAL